jgi:hypothetical protein
MSSIEEYLFTLPKGMTKDDIVKHIEEMKSSPGENNLKLIYNEVLKMGGNVIREYNSTHCYYLVGAVSTHEDYYYIVLDKDRTLRFLTCVGKIELVDEIPAELSVLMYLVSHEPDSLVQYIRKTIDTSKVEVLFTPIIINNKHY